MASRRDFLVTMCGVALGVFSLPFQGRAKAAPAPGKVAPPPPEFDLVSPPIWGGDEDRRFLLYTRGDGESMIWVADCEEDLQSMRRFYDATRNPGCPQIDPHEVFPIRRTPTEQRLLAAILQDFDSAVPRLAYARWLTDQGNTQGEYVRIDCELEHCPDGPERAELDDRWWEVLSTHGEEWFRPLAALGLWPTLFAKFFPSLCLHRGLINNVEVNIAGVLPERADWLFQAAPALTSLRLEFEGMDLAKIAYLPQMGQIRTLTIEPVLGDLSAADFQALATSPHLRNVRHLDLNCTSEISAATMSQLVGSPLFSGLESLELHSDAGLSAEVIGALASSAELSQLRELNLKNNKLDAAALARLATSKSFGVLKTIVLSDNPVGDDGLANLLTCDSLHGVEHLDIGSCELGDASIGSLTSWPAWPRLQRLTATSNGITAAGMSRLAASPHHASLTELDLAHNPLGDAGIAELANWLTNSQLTKLTLNGTECTAKGLGSLLTQSDLSYLAELELYSNTLGAAGAKLLAKAALPALEKLCVPDEEDIGKAGHKLLEERFGEAVTFI